MPFNPETKFCDTPANHKRYGKPKFGGLQYTVASLSVNDSAIMKINGVKRVIRLPYGVAIIGDTVEATKKGREALEVKW